MERKNKDTNPIYYKSAEEMDKPLSELMEELRNEISRTRGKLHDIKRSYGWEDRIEFIEGGLTCILVAMHSTMEEWKKFEEKQRAIAEKV
jgi:hypothetical protein